MRVSDMVGHAACLFALWFAGCSCSDPVDLREDGAVPLDGTAFDRGDGALADGDLVADAGRRDCAEYARVLCASADRCYRETIWFFGSVERCEAYFRGECGYERSLEDAGDRATALLECYEEHTDCELYRGEVECPLPPGTRPEGAPCRSTFQCAEGLWCAGADLSFQGGPLACDTGTCRLPLAEGATDCDVREDGNLCAGGLRCAESDSGTRCVPADPLPSAGEACGPGYMCAEGLYCSSFTTCHPVIANGAACDPSEPEISFMGPCGGTDTFACDPETRTCVQIERAFEGDPCVDGENRCPRECVDGVCPGWEWAFGASCASDTDCGLYACIDGMCAATSCD